MNPSLRRTWTSPSIQSPFNILQVFSTLQELHTHCHWRVFLPKDPEPDITVSNISSLRPSPVRHSYGQAISSASCPTQRPQLCEGFQVTNVRCFSRLERSLDFRSPHRVVHCSPQAEEAQGLVFLLPRVNCEVWKSDMSQMLYFRATLIDGTGL